MLSSEGLRSKKIDKEDTGSFMELKTKIFQKYDNKGLQQIISERSIEDTEANYVRAGTLPLEILDPAMAIIVPEAQQKVAALNQRLDPI